MLVVDSEVVSEEDSIGVEIVVVDWEEDWFVVVTLVVDSVVDLDVNIIGVVIIFDGVVISTTVPYIYI